MKPQAQSQSNPPSRGRQRIGKAAGAAIFVLAFYGAYVGVSYYIAQNAPCARPITYKIGTIDSRFKLSTSDVQTISKKAATLWDNSVNKQLLEYDANGTVVINFVYDDRQAFIDEQKTLTTQIDSEGKTIAATSAHLDSLKSQFDQLNASYSASVTYWNGQGGAPPDVYSQLESERTQLNKLASQINSLVATDNQKIATYNQNIAEANSRAGQTDTAGLYQDTGKIGGKSITIYEFSDINNLETTLTHEMGHALGLGHLTNPKAIMAAVMADSTSAPVLTADDISAIDQVCKIKS